MKSEIIAIIIAIIYAENNKCSNIEDNEIMKNKSLDICKTIIAIIAS